MILRVFIFPLMNQGACTYLITNYELRITNYELVTLLSLTQVDFIHLVY
jgi:hypothetical protein